MNLSVDDYLTDGCGRCKFYKTPQCKVHTWSGELTALRDILRDSGLDETRKWYQPCYTLNGANVIMMSAFKDYAYLSFFKGSLLKDPKNLLVSPGENVQAARQLRFTGVDQIRKLQPVIQAYIREAIGLEASGAKVEMKKHSDYPIPEELEKALKQDPELKQAFDALTPGRQRGYYLFIAAPKQSSTRVSRIEKSRERILAGKGYNERY